MEICCLYNTDEIKDSHWQADKDYPFQDMCMTLGKVGQPNDEAEVRWISVSCDHIKPFICQIRKYKQLSLIIIWYGYLGV